MDHLLGRSPLAYSDIPVLIDVTTGGASDGWCAVSYCQNSYYKILSDGFGTIIDSQRNVMIAYIATRGRAGQ